MPIDAKEYIARTIADELTDNSVVNLGIGLPTLVPRYVNKSRGILLHSENGLLGLGEDYRPEEENDPHVITSSGIPAKYVPGAAFFDSCVSFGIIRGGHLDVTVLGAMEVDRNGDIANYQVPGKALVGMGGAMDLCIGAKKVIVAMFHTQNGAPKILNKCKLPLTAERAVNTIVTEMGVIDVTGEGLILRSRNPEYSIEEIQKATEADLIIKCD